MLHKTIASEDEDFFFLYSQRQLEKKALAAVIKNIPQSKQEPLHVSQLAWV